MSLSVVEFPFTSAALVALFGMLALFITTKYLVATWTSAAIVALLVVFALWKFKIMPHVALLFPLLVVVLIAAIVTDAGFNYYDGQNEIPGTAIVATSALLFIVFGTVRGWF